MNYKKILILCMALAIVIIACVRITGHLSGKSETLGTDKDSINNMAAITTANATINESVNSTQPHISRAHAIKMLVLLRYSHDEIENLPRIINYEDTSSDKWYDKYLNAAASMGISIGEQECNPLAEMTFNDCNMILEQLVGDSGGTVQAAVDSRRVNTSQTVPDTAVITIDIWLELYNALCSGEISSVTGLSFAIRPLKMESIFLMSIIESDKNEVAKFETGESNVDENAFGDTGLGDETWEVATSAGAYHFDGFALDAYTNTTLNILSDGNEILHIYGASDVDTILENAWVCECNNDEIKLFYAGVETSFTRSSNCSGVVTANTVADITMSHGEIISAVSKGERVADKILTVSDSFVETVQYGRIPLAISYRIYGLYNGVARMDMKSILVGYSATELVIDNGSVCALLVTSEVKPDMIRVALMTNNHAGYYHKNASISSDCGMTISYGGSQAVLAAGENYTIDAGSDVLASGRVTITPAAGGRLKINSIKRSAGKMLYRGSLELSSGEEGIIIINELPIEEYLYAVVPSEMPVSYGIEPLKVQAVCARSYAYMQVMSNALAAYGAHVDDSTAYQVYNNIAETPESVEAVNQTKGQLLTYNGKVVSTYYFSTSCGHTSSGSDVWFGMKNVPYLRGQLQNTNNVSEAEVAAIKDKYDDLSDETLFKAFLDDSAFKSYDSTYPWYRWSLTLSADDVKKSLEASIAQRYNINPSLILTKRDDGKYVSEPVETVGNIRSVKVEKRSSGGIATSLIIKGSKRTVKILSEYNIRLLLAPLSAHISRNDNSTVDGLALLPSAFISVETGETDGKRMFSIKGGGYGHGVGMSQNGAKAMAEEGAKYDDILKHYYSGCDVSS